MILIISDLTDSRFNLAAEEFFLKESNEDFLMLYIDEPSVIVGKHQNTVAEVNLRYIIENNINVIRRISGGGTVYHDKGNLNFCFISNGKEGHLIDFEKYTSPITEILRNFGIKARLEGKNDLRVNGLKISGNAEHVYKNRVLHHGTLLVSTDLTKLSEALRVSNGIYTDNAVKSIRSKVANLNELSNLPVNIEILKQQIIEYFIKKYRFTIAGLTSNEIESIKKLADKKYSTWEWNFGYSPKYQFQNSFKNKGSGIKIFIEVENGIVTNADIPGFGFLNLLLINVKHEYQEIEKVLSNNLQLSSEEARILAWSFF